MKDMLSFDTFQELFDCLNPSDITEYDYCLWLKFMTKDCPECYLDKGVNVFMHMWTSVSYTHLDVYKRQGHISLVGTSQN